MVFNKLVSKYIFFKLNIKISKINMHKMILNCTLKTYIHCSYESQCSINILYLNSITFNYIKLGRNPLNK